MKGSRPLFKKILSSLLIIIGAGILAYSGIKIYTELTDYAKEMDSYHEDVAAAKDDDATPEQRQNAEGKDEQEPPVDVVAGKKNYHYKSVDMAEVMQVHGGGDEGMNLITCTGSWVPGEKTFDTRAIIFTRRV